MLQETSKFNSVKFKKLFLMKFTKELIMNSGTREIFELKQILKNEKKEEIKNKSQKIIEKNKFKEEKKSEKMIPSIITDNSNLNHKFPQIKNIKPIFINPQIKKIPQKNIIKNKFNNKNYNKTLSFRNLLNTHSRMLPPRLQKIMPIPSDKQIDLGKLNVLIKDPKVRYIECYGAGKNINVRIPDTKPTNIILDNNEINGIIEKFSQSTKIPIQEGVFKVAVGRLVFSAIISEVVGSKFIIKKLFMIPSPRLRKMNYRGF